MEWCGRVRGIVCVGVEGVVGRDGRQGWHAAQRGRQIARCAPGIQTVL